jgi:1-deoxy-D-xylulose-5-phosphate synthase
LHTIFNQFETIITIEDGVIKGGFGSAIVQFSSQNKYTSKIQILGIPDEFIEHGTINELQQYCKIDVTSLENIFSSY